MTSSNDSQRIIRVPGRRRVRLTAAAGVGAEPPAETRDEDVASGPNDERMRREVPPHY